MSITVTKEGPYFTSGPIKFSEIRTRFKESSSGSISASELFRNTNITDVNPIVPDSTENDQVADEFTFSGGKFTFSGTKTDWKASLMRDSIKRYAATQSGTDLNADFGLYTASGGKGIDWDGQGVADAAGSTTGNITRNVQKAINVTGTCGSNDTGTNGLTGGGGVGADKKPAAQLVLPNPLKAVNTTINNSGRIEGAGGQGGCYTDWQSNSDPGKDGGIALKIVHEGDQNDGVIVNNTGEILGGGGSGEQGEQGFEGSAGTCSSTTTSTSSGWYVGGVYSTCGGGGGGCGGDQNLGSVCFWQVDCDGDGSFDGSLCADVCQWTSTSTSYNNYGSSTDPVPGKGGCGGDGAGYGQTRQNGSAGTAAQQASCSNGSLEGGSRATDGGRGGNGGEHGQGGQGTLGTPGDGGKSGAAICGKHYDLRGSTGSPNVMGSTSNQCDGSAGPSPTPQGPPVLTLTMPTRNQHVRFNRPATHLCVTSRSKTNPTISDGNTVEFQIRYRWSDIGSDWDTHLTKLQIFDRGADRATATPIKEFVRSSRSGDVYETLTLLPGSYPLQWVGLHPFNTANHELVFGNTVGHNCGGSMPRIINYDSNETGFFPDDRDGFNNPDPDPNYARRNEDCMRSSDQHLWLVDADCQDANGEFQILPKIGGTGNFAWERSYNPAAGHDTQNADGSYVYDAVKTMWSQYMRDYAVTTSITDTNSESSLWADDAIMDLRMEFNPSGQLGKYIVKAQSDNSCKFYWGYNPDPTPSNATGFFETTPYDSHGASFGSGLKPAGFGASHDTGRIWPYTSEGGNGQANWFSSGWNRELNASGEPNQGPTYYELDVTQDSTVHILIRLTNRFRTPDTDLWEVNPNGIGFQIFKPGSDSNTVLTSLNAVVTDPFFGLPVVNWSVTNIRHGTAPDYMQGSSRAIKIAGTKFPYISDDLFNNGVTDTASGSAQMLPQCNNDGTPVGFGQNVTTGMKYTLTAHNTEGVDEKEIIIN